MEQNRVCCLYRVSTDKQVDYDNNHEADIPMQRKACHRFADKMGWNIVHEEQEKLSKLRAEVIKSIQGESAYSQELLAGLVNETDEKVRELESICTAAEHEVEEKQILMKDLSDSYDEIISWSELYDSASLEAKKMIVNAMITRIDVYNGYELNVEFNFNIRQFFEGIAEEETEAEKTAALPKTA